MEGTLTSKTIMVDTQWWISQVIKHQEDLWILVEFKVITKLFHLTSPEVLGTTTKMDLVAIPTLLTARVALCFQLFTVENVLLKLNLTTMVNHQKSCLVDFLQIRKTKSVIMKEVMQRSQAEKKKAFLNKIKFHTQRKLKIIFNLVNRF